MPFLNLADVRLAYEASGAGPPVTFLHGFTQSRAMWDEVVRELEPRWTLVLPDLRGHGDTEVKAGGAYTLDACLGDLSALWSELGHERSHVVGYSMGGRLALRLAAKRPGRLLSLVTISARPGLDEPARSIRIEDDRKLAAAIERHGMEWFVEHWEALPMFSGIARRGPDFSAAMRERRRRNRAWELAASLRGMGAGATPPLRDELRGLRAPALFVAGAEDAPYAEAALRLAELTGGRAEVLPDTGHNVAAERPRELARVLAAHLSTL